MGFRVIPMLLATSLAAGCASGLPREDGGKLNYVDYAGEPVDRFTATRISGWTPVSRNQLVVWVGTNQAWLLKIWDGCEDLQYSNVLGVTQTSLSVTRFDKVRVGNDRCPIEEIRPIDVRHLKADRAAMRTAAEAPPAPPTPAPPPQ